MIDSIPPDLFEIMNKAAGVLDELFTPYGFTLLVFDFGHDGRMNYISNANREDMIASMKEFIAVHEGRRPDITKLERQ